MIATATKPKAAKGTTPAVGYIRMSSKEQDASPEQQRAEIIKLAERQGCKIIRWYFDPGITGDDTRKRKQFLRMMHDAEHKRDFAAILCWDSDRFGRFDSVEAGRWVFPLRQAGIWLVTVAQGRIDWNTFQGRLMYTVQTEGKHQFLIDLSRNTLRGKRESAKNGKSGALQPMGYDRQFYNERGELVCRVKYGEKFRRQKGWSVRFVLSQDTELVATIRWVWQTFVETDCGIDTIAADLNRRGIKTPTGRKWSFETIEGILTNRVYTGANVYGRKRYGKYHHLGDNGEVVEGSAGPIQPGDPIITDAVHDAMIDQETFDLAQHKIESRRRQRTKPRNSEYLLSGIILCGHCGGTMTGRGYEDSGHARGYYVCTDEGPHPNGRAFWQVPQRALEAYILGLIEQRLGGDEVINQIRAAIHQQAKDHKAFRATTTALQARIAAMDKKIERGTENLLLANPDDMEALSKMLASWRKERSAMQRELEAAATCPDGLTAEQRINKAVAELKRMRSFLASREPARVRAILKALIKEIRLWSEPYGKQSRLAKGYIEFAQDLYLIPEDGGNPSDRFPGSGREVRFRAAAA